MRRNRGAEPDLIVKFNLGTADYRPVLQNCACSVVYDGTESLDLEINAMDIRKQLANCSTSTIPYRYDLRSERNFGFSYFVDNGLTQSVLGTQDGGAACHESMNVSNADAGIVSDGSGDTLT